MELKIRPMTVDDDLEQVTDWFGLIGTEWLLDYEPVPTRREDSREQLRQWMRGADGNSCILLAEHPATADAPAAVMGFAICLLQMDPYTGRKYGTIHGIYVDPSCRGHGTGRELKQGADNWCRDGGAAYLKAHLGIGNRAMLRVCKLLGYEPWMVTWIRKFE